MPQENVTHLSDRRERLARQTMIVWQYTDTTALRLPDDLSADDWKQIGLDLSTIKNANGAWMWWIGDWWAFDNHRFGDRTALVTSPGWPGPKLQTCKNAASVCRKIKTSCRQDVLSYSAHQEISRLPNDKIAEALAWAVVDGRPRSKSKIREYVNQRVQPASPSGGDRGTSRRTASANAPAPGPAPAPTSAEETLSAAIRAARATAPAAVAAGERLNESLLAQAGALLYLDHDKTYPEVEELTGLSNVVLRVAVAREEGHREERADPLIDPATVRLSQRNQAHLRQEERRLGREHQERLLAVEETVRQRVIERNADYVARLREREQTANRTEATYRRMIDNRNHPFTVDEFEAILRCLHPDTANAANATNATNATTTNERPVVGARSVSAERLQVAFVLFQAKKLQLTGEE